MKSKNGSRSGVRPTSGRQSTSPRLSQPLTSDQGPRKLTSRIILSAAARSSSTEKPSARRPRGRCRMAGNRPRTPSAAADRPGPRGPRRHGQPEQAQHRQDTVHSARAGCSRPRAICGSLFHIPAMSAIAAVLQRMNFRLRVLDSPNSIFKIVWSSGAGCQLECGVECSAGPAGISRALKQVAHPGQDDIRIAVVIHHHLQAS